MVLAQCEELQEWEKKMIAHAPRGNIVFAECVQENGEKYLWYNRKTGAGCGVGDGDAFL